MKYLALDYGSAKIGVAIGDSETRIASPFIILKNDKNFLSNLKKIIKTEEIDELVVGLPQGLQSQESKQYQHVNYFVKLLKSELDKKIIVQDEKLTSKQAQTLLKGAKHKSGDDDVAAMLILQGFLDQK